MQRRSNTGDCSAGSSDDRSRVADAATQQAPPRSVGRPPSNTGRATYEYHPEYHPRVGHKPFLPKDRHTAVNYLRLLLYDSVFDRHSYKSGANTTKACARGNTINDVHHFLLVKISSHLLLTFGTTVTKQEKLSFQHRYCSPPRLILVLLLLNVMPSCWQLFNLSDCLV